MTRFGRKLHFTLVRDKDTCHIKSRMKFQNLIFLSLAAAVASFIINATGSTLFQLLQALSSRIHDDSSHHSRSRELKTIINELKTFETFFFTVLARLYSPTTGFFSAVEEGSRQTPERGKEENISRQINQKHSRVDFKSLTRCLQRNYFNNLLKCFIGWMKCVIFLIFLLLVGSFCVIDDFSDGQWGDREWQLFVEFFAGRGIFFSWKIETPPMSSARW